MIRAAIMSDLHLEAEGDPVLRTAVRGWGDDVRAQGADLVLLAGDIHSGLEGIGWAALEFAGLPVAYVFGNHEFHGFDHAMLLREARAAGLATPNVRVLEDEAWVIDVRGVKVHILGCTLWSDFALEARIGPDGTPLVDDINRAQFEAARSVGDFEEISRSLGARFMPHHAEALHQRSRQWLDRRLADVRQGDVSIVVSHMAPSLESIEQIRRGDPINAYYASDLEDLITWHQVDLWVHGHTHYNVDFDLGHTRVIANMRGYPKDGMPFRPRVVDIGQP